MGERKRTATELYGYRTNVSLEEIHWWDHCGMGGWQDCERAHDHVDEEALYCVSFALVLGETKSDITHCNTISKSQVHGLGKILKRDIVYRRVLRKKA